MDLEPKLLRGKAKVNILQLNLRSRAPFFPPYLFTLTSLLCLNTTPLNPLLLNIQTMSAIISFRRYQRTSYSASPSSSSSPLQSIPESDVPQLEGSALDTDDDASQCSFFFSTFFSILFFKC